jgi:hypothetical protein
MRTTCQMPSFLLLMSLSCFATQWHGAHSKAVTISRPSIEEFSFDQAEGLPQTGGIHPGLHTMRNGLEQAGATMRAAPQAGDLPYSSSGLPLLSCIGAGMALGGLLSARWWESRDK